MAYELAINCGAYSVTIEGKDREVFEQVKAVPEVEDKEVLITALLELLPPDGILSVSRKTADGKFCDGPDGEPGYQKFNPEKGVARSELIDGEMKESNRLCLVVEKHYKDGKLNNTPDGTPAWQTWNDKGELTYRAYKTDDLYNDGPNGEAACWRIDSNTGDIQLWHCQDGKDNDLADGTPSYQRFTKSGQLIQVAYKRDNKMNDPGDGTPGSLKFDRADGSLCSAWHYKDDVEGKALRSGARKKVENTATVQALKKLHL